MVHTMKLTLQKCHSKYEIYDIILEDRKGKCKMRKILLIEDNETIIIGLKYTLEQENFDVDIAKNIIEAKSKIKKYDYNIYLLDIALPDGEGYEICKYVKEKGNYPVIFLTAKDEEKDVVQGLDMGADDYIIKPFRTRELVSRINSVLRRYENTNIEEHKIQCKNHGKGSRSMTTWKRPVFRFFYQ